MIMDSKENNDYLSSFPSTLKLLSSSTHSGLKFKHPEFVESVIANTRSVDYVKSSCSCIAGSLAGVLGLTNHHGLIFYLISSIITSLIIIIVSSTNLLNRDQNLSNSEAVYFRSKITLWSVGLVDNVFGYLLWWTLFYGLVHIYD
ncbi:hypothetical protein PPACK8108_LOCUS11924 [Phakopsora pachyrhizi]|uniref:ER membrane protein complex subunit 6 n=1 Tax=Phakopsora pachyrhizi TaxID=170000 RepID=A0AAV0B3V7_PHAPC|nr:hypothetical protein PPACK8108_LOCUS11924 [Phakopsora pachyrhizi]